MQHRRWTSVLLAAALVATVAGCGRVSDRRTGGAHLLVTEGFGARVMHDQQALDGHSVMDALRGVATVETEFGGGFVSAIDGVRSDPGRQRDWFYFVNGVAPGRGADQQTLRPGDSVWWDYRPWGGLPEGAPVVGLWPEPFVHGYPDAPATVIADPPLDDALRAAGAPVGSGTSDWRVIVGADQALRTRDPTWRATMKDPAAAGLTVRISGDHVDALTPDGATFVTIPAGRAIAVALATGTDPDHAGVVLAVAGLDAAAAKAAAATIARDPAVLRGRFAVVFDARGRPISAGGRA